MLRRAVCGLLLVAGCEFHVSPPPKTQAEINREEEAAAEQARQRDEAEQRKRLADQRELDRLEREAASKKFQEEREEREAAEKQARMERWQAAEDARKKAREEAPEDEGYLAYKWAEASCKLSQEDPHYVRHCDPVCWDEEVIQCPVFKCKTKPPTAGWVELANRRVCDISRGTTNRRARAIGEGGYPPPQYDKR